MLIVTSGTALFAGSDRLAREDDGISKGATGAHYHGNAEQGILYKDIAGVIGRKLNVPVVSKTLDEASQDFDWFALMAMANNPTSSWQCQCGGG